LKEITLKPIIHHDEYSALLEKPINDYFAEAIFEPLLDVVREAGIKPNEKDQAKHACESPVKKALRDGAIYYAASQGMFTGKFTAPVSRELRGYGAVYSGGVFRLKPEDVPLEIKAATVQSEAASREVHLRVLDVLDEMTRNLPQAQTGVKMDKPIEKLTAALDKQLSKSFDGVPKKTMPAPAPIRPENVEATAKSVESNLEISLKDFSLKQIKILREKILENLRNGGRSDRLGKIIEARYGIAKRYAAARAEHEAALLIAKYREQRYRAMGIQSYIWETQHDERVRHTHRILDQTRQLWDAPPVTNSNGDRNNPGEDFNCRCVSRGILKLALSQIHPN